MVSRRIHPIVILLIVGVIAVIVVRIIVSAGSLTTGASVPRGGSQIVYLRAVDRNNALYDVYLLQVDSAVATQLTQGGQIRRAVWSPDGESLVLQYEPPSYSRVQLFLLKVGTGELTSLFETELNVALLQWTANGKRLVFEGNRSGFGLNANVMAYDLNSKQLVTLMQGGAAPSVSPDGKTIAFSAVRAGDADAEIYLMDSDGNNVRKLLQNPGADTVPVWSPPGDRLLVVSNKYDVWGGTTERSFFVVNAGGSDLVQFNRLDTYSLPLWSPDGQEVFYPNVSRSLCSVKANGGSEKCISGARSIAWSPNKTQISYDYSLKMFDSPMICVAPADAPENRRCFADVPKGFSPTWRP